MYDLKLENAQDCDGLVNPIVLDAVVVQAGRIAATGVLGVHSVWVNGERVVDEQGLVPELRRPGQVLREFDS